MAKTGPKLKELKGLRKSRQITITIPAELHDAILQLMQEQKTLNKSGVIQRLIKIGLNCNQKSESDFD